MSLTHFGWKIIWLFLHLFLVYRTRIRQQSNYAPRPISFMVSATDWQSANVNDLAIALDSDSLVQRSSYWNFTLNFWEKYFSKLPGYCTEPSHSYTSRALFLFWCILIPSQAWVYTWKHKAGGNARRRTVVDGWENVMYCMTMGYFI